MAENDHQLKICSCRSVTVIR